jgi:outer membrane protein assembly factor BamB
MVYMPDEGSSPAVADGRVFVVTNTGIIIAFEADTGRPAWAYQYKSTNPAMLNKKRVLDALALIASPYQPNPVVVRDGRVICLPADSDKLLALRADTGKPLWSTDRRKLHNLTALGDSRLLLSGKGFAVIDASTGKEVWTSKEIDTILGRPAVTRDAILASGTGEIIQISLKDFSVTRLPVKHPDAILGNLICIDGKVLAANAAGVSAYFASPSER